MSKKKPESLLRPTATTIGTREAPRKATHPADEGPREVSEEDGVGKHALRRRPGRGCAHGRGARHEADPEQRRRDVLAGQPQKPRARVGRRSVVPEVAVEHRHGQAQ